jgi:hypothetical protein
MGYSEATSTQPDANTSALSPDRPTGSLEARDQVVYLIFINVIPITIP